MLSLGLVSLSQSPELLARVEAAVASQRAAVDLEPQSAAAYRALAEAYAQHKFMRAASTHLFYRHTAGSLRWIWGRETVVVAANPIVSWLLVGNA